MSETAVDAAIAALTLPATPSVLDTGCGSGEILLRTLKTHPSARGLGVDLDADAIAEARHRANGSSARFEVRDAAAIEGRFDAVINVGSSHAHGGFPGALTALRDLAPVALYGEGFWRRPRPRPFWPRWETPPSTSWLTSTVCAPQSKTSALTSCTSRSPASTIGRGMRRRSPLTPNSTELPIPSPTPGGSATDARCLRAPTRSDSLSSSFAPESHHTSADPHRRIMSSGRIDGPTTVTSTCRSTPGLTCRRAVPNVGRRCRSSPQSEDDRERSGGRFTRPSIQGVATRVRGRSPRPSPPGLGGSVSQGRRRDDAAGCP